MTLEDFLRTKPGDVLKWFSKTPGGISNSIWIARSRPSSNKPNLEEDEYEMIVDELSIVHMTSLWVEVSVKGRLIVEEIEIKHIENSNKNEFNKFKRDILRRLFSGKFKETPSITFRLPNKISRR